MNRSALRGLQPGLLVLVASLAAGCGSARHEIGPPPPPTVVVHDTPQSTMTALEQIYEYQLKAEYAKVLANDFRYTFSSATDPALVTMYGLNWGRNDETISADHLFNGFTSMETGQHYPGASVIAMTLESVQYLDDPEHADSTAYYKWVTVARAIVSIEIPGTPEPAIFSIDARHDFHLVRGDAAVLVAGQPATSNQWYIRRWDDLSTFGSGAPGLQNAGHVPSSSKASTWGAVRAMYR